MRRIVLTFWEWPSAEALAAIHAECGALRLPGLDAPNLRVATAGVPDDGDASQVLADLTGRPEVKRAHFDVKLEQHGVLFAPITDPSYAKQKHLWRHGYQGAWRHTTGNPAVKVGDCDSGLLHILDFDWPTGLDAYHGYYDREDVLDVFPFAVDSNLHPVFRASHGTCTYGQVFAKHNGGGGVGIAPGCHGLFGASQYTFEVDLGEGPFQTGGMSLAGMLATWGRMIERGARVINNSWGLTGNAWNSELQSIYDACLAADAAGIIIVASAGNANFNNDAPTFYHMPQKFFRTVVVGASDFDDTKASFSNYGSSTDITAIGRLICLTTGGGSYDLDDDAHYVAWYSGTSFTGPQVVGVMGLVMSVNPALTRDEVIALVLANTDEPRLSGPALSLYRQFFPNANALNAHKCVLAALATVPANAGVVYPFMQAWLPGTAYPVSEIPSGHPNNGEAFTGDPGLGISVVGGVTRQTLDGPVKLEVRGYSSAPVTSVEVWLGSTLLYVGPPAVLDGVASQVGPAQQLRIVARTATGQGEETYSDVVVSTLDLGDLILLSTTTNLGLTASAIQDEVAAQALAHSHALTTDAIYLLITSDVIDLVLLGMEQDATQEEVAEAAHAALLGFATDGEWSGDLLAEAQQALDATLGVFADAQVDEAGVWVRRNLRVGADWLAGPGDAAEITARILRLVATLRDRPLGASLAEHAYRASLRDRHDASPRS